MSSPLEIFDNPHLHLDFLTKPRDDDFELQHFDRKEAPQDSTGSSISPAQLARLREDVTECISAFSNANREGGLLVIGISKTGEITGTKHLTGTAQQHNQLQYLTRQPECTLDIS